MSPTPDPRWIGLACRVYSACLWFYPASLRLAHGEEMLLNFRDRCREVASGQVSAWRAFGVELIPDLLRSATGAQFDLGIGPYRRRAFGGLIVLSLLAVALLTQPQWSGTATRGMNQVGRLWLMAREAREMKRHERAVGSLADELEGRGDLQSRALAALVHRVLFDQREFRYLFSDDGGWTNPRFADAGARASALAGPLLGRAADAYTLSMAAQACAIEAGCNRDLAIRRLVAIDPDNAFGWMLAFKWAAQHQQPERMAEAMTRIGQAHYYENYIGRIHRDLFAAAQRHALADVDLLADVASDARLIARVDTSDFVHDLRFQCKPRKDQPAAEPRWVETHPEAAPACLHLARLLLRSTDLFGANWARNRLQQAGITVTAADEQLMRDAFWLAWQDQRGFSVTRNADGRGWVAWSDANWLLWSESWRVGDGQIPSLRRWLKSRGLPEHAPADFEVAGTWSGIY